MLSCLYNVKQHIAIWEIIQYLYSALSLKQLKALDEIDGFDELCKVSRTKMKYVGKYVTS